MQTQQTIALVGDWGVAAGCSINHLAKGNNKLLLCGGEQQKMEQQLTEIIACNPLADAEVETCFKEACWQADVILLSVPIQQLPFIAAHIKTVANRKLLVKVEQENFRETSVALLQNLLPNCMWVQLIVQQSQEEHPSLKLIAGTELTLQLAKGFFSEQGLVPSTTLIAAAKY